MEPLLTSPFVIPSVLVSVGWIPRLTRCHKCWKSQIKSIICMILMSIILLRIILPRHNTYSACACELSLQPFLVEVLPFLNLLTSSHDLSRSPPHFDIRFLQPLVSISPNSEPPGLVVHMHPRTHSSGNLPCKRYHGRAPTSSRPASLSLRTCL